MSVAWVAVGATLVTGAMGASAAGSAADSQAASADKSLALQKEQFDKNIELQEPFRQGGITAQNKLMQLLGLSPNQAATGAAPAGGGATPGTGAPRMTGSGPRPMLQTWRCGLGAGPSMAA